MVGTCVATGSSAGVTDLVPIIVDEMEIREYRLVGGEEIFLPYKKTIGGGGSINGRTFTYTPWSEFYDVYPESFTETIDKYTPFNIRIRLSGQNSNDKDIEIVTEVEVSNSCEEYPVFEKGQSFGWFMLVSLLVKQ